MKLSEELKAIKEIKAKRRITLEDLGYEQVSPLLTNLNIGYIKKDKENVTCVSFLTESQTVEVVELDNDGNDVGLLIDMVLLEAITNKCKELRWL